MQKPDARLARAWWSPAGAGQKARAPAPAHAAAAPARAAPHTSAAASCMPARATVSMPGTKPHCGASHCWARAGSAE